MNELPRLGLAMIVKNAEADLRQCLASLRPHISHWVVVDTGSTDGTQALVRKALKGVPGTLYERPFVNFGVNRSEAFALARGTADWLVASDADMTWEIDPDFEPGSFSARCLRCQHTFDQHCHEFCSKDNACLECPCPQYDAGPAAYMLEMGKHTSFSYRLPLLLRGDLPWKSVGAAHEYTVLEDGTYGRRVSTDKVRIDMGAIDRSSPEKSRFYASLLQADLAKDPDNPRTVAYLGQTYRDLGRRDDAKAMFDRRAKMPGWDQETFYAAYQAALYDPWPAQAMSLLAAWEMRPQRLEPLYCLIAELNRRDLHRAAYALSLVTPPLCDDILFVENWVWNWGLKFQRSIAAWYCGHQGESRNLCDELLAMELPADIRAAVERNRAL